MMGRRSSQRTDAAWMSALIAVLALACLTAVAVLTVGPSVQRTVSLEDDEQAESPPPATADRPWGIDFDIKFVRAKRQWQISNLVLHPPPPPDKVKLPPKIMTKATFPFYELRSMNQADAEVKKKLEDEDTDPKLKEALEAGMEQNSGALEAAVGCAEGSEPGSTIKTACPGVGSGKPQEVKRQWNMGFPPQVGAAAQQSSTFKRRGMTGGDVDRGQQ